jgi:hypothetical protein
MTSAESIRALDVVFSQKSRWLLCYDGMKVIQECKYTSTYCHRTSLCYDGIKLIQKHKGTSTYCDRSCVAQSGLYIPCTPCRRHGVALHAYPHSCARHSTAMIAVRFGDILCACTCERQCRGLQWKAMLLGQFSLCSSTSSQGFKENASQAACLDVSWGDELPVQTHDQL